MEEGKQTGRAWEADLAASRHMERQVAALTWALAAGEVIRFARRLAVLVRPHDERAVGCAPRIGIMPLHPVR